MTHRHYEARRYVERPAYAWFQDVHDSRVAVAGPLVGMYLQYGMYGSDS